MRIKKAIRYYIKTSIVISLVVFQVSAYIVNDFVVEHVQKANAYMENIYTKEVEMRPVGNSTSTIPIEIPEIMKRISGCETLWNANAKYDFKNHYEANGKTVRMGKVTPDDIGLYQISWRYHGMQAMRMGLNLFVPEDNETYALYLYHTGGTDYWNPSKECWGVL